MDDRKAQEIEKSLGVIGVKARVRDLCGRCEEPIGKARAARCDFAPYTGMRLHAKCIAALVAETAEEES